MIDCHYFKPDIQKVQSVVMEKIHVGLFEANYMEMSDYDYENPQPCHFCGTITKAIHLHCSDVPNLKFKERDNKYGCFGCLSKNRFKISHETEFGSLDAQSIELEQSNTISKESKIQLLSTPSYTTWQQEFWLTHCDSFMTYIGEWKPSDFVNQAKDIHPRELFMKMTKGSDQSLWDEFIVEDSDMQNDWYATFYAFKCTQCNKLRGHWDFP